MQLFSNNASTTLNGVINNVVTSIVVANGAVFPSPGTDYFLLTIIGLDVNGIENAWEIVKVTARSTNTLTVVRGQEGTAAASWPHAATIQLRMTAGAENATEAHKNNTSNPHNVTASQVGLGAVNNTSDANKPVSSAQQTALDLKANLVSPSFTTPNLGAATADSIDAPIYLNPREITADFTVGSAYNAASVGPITISDGVTVTVADNATWSIH